MRRQPASGPGLSKLRTSTPCSIRCCHTSVARSKRTRIRFASLSKTFLNGVNGLLFGSFLGVTSGDVAALGIVAALVLGTVAAVGRPLLFASTDPAVAAARGVPVRALGAVFLVLLGATAAEVSQVTGSLLVFALLVMPAATAQKVTARPALSLALTVVIGALVTWVGLALAYFIVPSYPIGFYVTSLAFVLYIAAYLGRAAAPFSRARTRARVSPAGGAA